jgi:hypothetical protein
MPGSVVDTAYIEVNGQWLSVVTGSRLCSDTKIVLYPPLLRIEWHNGSRFGEDTTPSIRPQTFTPLENS